MSDDKKEQEKGASDLESATDGEKAAGKKDADASPDTPPDRMSIDPTSRFFVEGALERGVGIRFKGKVRTNVQEYCISEGWVRMAVGKSVDRYGRPLTIKSKGTVEAWYEDLGEDAPVASAG